MTNRLQQDLRNGKKAEIQVKPILEELFGKLKSTDRYNDKENFDFYNKRYFVEHKQRSSTPFGKYDSLFFDKVKYNRYLSLKKQNPKLRFFIVWSCKDDRYMWEFTEDTKEFYEQVNCFDRGRGGVEATKMIHVKNEYIAPFSDFYTE